MISVREPKMLQNCIGDLIEILAFIEIFPDKLDLGPIQAGLFREGRVGV